MINLFSTGVEYTVTANFKLSQSSIEANDDGVYPTLSNLRLILNDLSPRFDSRILRFENTKQLILKHGIRF